MISSSPIVLSLGLPAWILAGIPNSVADICLILGNYFIHLFSKRAQQIRAKAELLV